MEKDDNLGSPEMTSKKEKNDNFIFKGKIIPKLDVKELLRNKKIEFKSIDISVSLHKEWSGEDVTMDASFKVDLNKLNDGRKAIKNANISFSKKF